MSDEYVLTVQLPVTMTECLTSDMITVSARKENKLAIVVDVWHAENNGEHTFRSSYVYVDQVVLILHCSDRKSVV